MERKVPGPYRWREARPLYAADSSSSDAANSSSNASNTSDADYWLVEVQSALVEHESVGAMSRQVLRFAELLQGMVALQTVDHRVFIQ